MNEIIISNDSSISMIAQVLDEMKAEQGNSFSLEKVNLAELERRTGIPRQRLRTLQKNGFNIPDDAKVSKRKAFAVLNGYTAVLDNLLQNSVDNSVVCLERLKQAGCNVSLSTVKRYIASHRYLIPAKRHVISSQGNRGRRYTTGPGEAFQMDWGFVNVQEQSGEIYQVSCFAMVCHHCGTFYIEFFPNAKQENLFIGMLHAFSAMGIPRYVLTDNMKSVVIKRDFEGNPIWQRDYEAFMKCVGFNTKLCKPYHPFTKGKVERLIRYVKDNFIIGNSFYNISDLNERALEWCMYHNSHYHKTVAGIPSEIHGTACSQNLSEIDLSGRLMYFLCPLRSISFDGFVNYEGRRFGVPYTYTSKLARVCRSRNTIYIYSEDLSQLLVTHDVTWSKKDRYCNNQFEIIQPEEFPTAPVKSNMTLLEQTPTGLGFDKFDFDQEDDANA